MRTVTRTGVGLSVVAALALYGLQLLAGMTAALGIIATGMIAGLCVAKWLERDWYGRQLEAGARAGAIACGVAGLSSALYLLGHGYTSIDALVAGSHAPVFSLADLTLALSPLGPTGAIIAVSVVATLLGIATAGLTAQVFGWDKDKRSLRVIAQARLLAQALQVGELGAQVTPTGDRPSSPSVRLYGRTSPTAGPAAAIGPTSTSGVRRTAAPRTAAEANPPFSSWDDETAATENLPAAPKARAAKPAKPGKLAAEPRHTSNARATGDAITAEERAALMAWEEAMNGDSQPEGQPREPKASQFLNEPVAAPRRNRKKTNTRDWLC